MDFGKEFRDAWTLLKANPATTIPQAISILLFALWFMAIIHTSGAVPLVQDLIRADHEFKATHPEPSMFDFAAYEQYSADQDAFYAAQFGGSLEDTVLQLFTLDLLKRLLILTAVAMLLTFYATTIAYAAVGIVAVGSPFTLASTLKLTNKLFLRHIGMRILQTLILFVPLLVGALLVIGAFFVHEALGILLLIVAILAGIAYMVYIGTRLAFCEPAMFMKQLPAVDSIGASFAATRGRFGSAFAVLVIVSLLSWFASGISYQPLVEIFVGFSLSVATAKLAALSIIFVFLLVVHAAVFTVRDLFLFMAYREFDTHG